VTAEGSSIEAVQRARLERILEPWNRPRGALRVWLVGPDGTLVAGRPAAATGSDGRLEAEVSVGEAAIGRLIAAPASPSDARLRAAIDALAVAIGELATEAGVRAATERALGIHRTEHAANALGIDAAELAKGRLQQRRIVSLEAPDVPGYDLASHYAPAREIGGDFFELFRLVHRRHPLATGKGLDAALLMAFARPVMHTALEASRGPAEAIERTNRVLVEERRGTLFITLLSAELHPASGRIRIASAGHEPPLLIPAHGGEIRAVGEAGVLMGAFATIGPPETQIVLAPGDVLLFYTDGVTDALSPGGARFGDARLLEALQAARGGSAPEVLAAVRDRLDTFRATADPADDVTLVALGRRTGRRRGPRS
jgi:serine phosphatase RsbU (regulator of sigma subunit)